MIPTEEQATIRDMARRFAEEKLAPERRGLGPRARLSGRGASPRWARSASWA